MKRRIVPAVLAAALLALLAWEFFFSSPSPSRTTVTGMGTLLDFRLYGDDSVKDELLKMTEEVEKACSLSLPDSAANRLKRDGTVTEPILAAQVRACQTVCSTSDGAFDLTVGALSTRWHIGFDDARVPAEEEIRAALSLVDGSLVSVSGDTVSCGKGQVLDFGAVTKGYACDRAKEILQNSSCRGAVVSIGGSLLFYGSPTRAGRSWTAAVRDPWQENAYAGTFSLKEGFVSTSGSYERFLEAGGKRYHHILDPRTGYPAESDLISVTVVAPTGLLSDALSTACFAAGSEKCEALLRTFDAQAILLFPDRTYRVIGELSFIPENGYEKAA